MAGCAPNAQGQLPLGDCLDFQGQTAGSTYPNFGTLISNILPNIYTAAGLIIFFMILLGGAMMVFNASNAEAQSNGKAIITAAIIGLLVVFGSFWIIQIVQVITGVKILNSGI